MPIIRKIIRIGHSYAITIPKSWIRSYEKEKGCKIRELALEINGVLRVSPVIEKMRGS